MTAITAAFRQQASIAEGDMSLVVIRQQSIALGKLFSRIMEAVALGFNPIVCVDLDLTSVLAPEKSCDVLNSLRPGVSGFNAVANVPAGTFSTTLDGIWRNAIPALLPRYTSTSIQAYGIYCTAELQVRTGDPIGSDRLAECEKWIADQVHRRLRIGYWHRDLAADRPATGFTYWARRVKDAGACIVFLSNRDTVTREVSLFQDAVQVYYRDTGKNVPITTMLFCDSGF